MNADDLIYGNYWKRKQIIAQGLPHIPVIRHYLALSAIPAAERERTVTDMQVITDTVRQAPSILDVGAGDLRVKRCILDAGFRGEYHTQDVGGEYEHTYTSLDDISRRYAAIVCLDVLEHLKLADGMLMLGRMYELLEPGGLVVIQTPNALCIRNPIGWDMTHVQTYNANDLYASLKVLGLDVRPYKIVLDPPPRSFDERWKQKVRDRLDRFMRIDRADNLLMIGQKPEPNAG